LSTGRTIGYARLYAVTKFSRHKDEAVKLVKFFGGTDQHGRFVTAKEWVFRNALVWGYPAVGKDPEVVQEVNRWGSLDFIQAQLEKAVHISAVAPYRSPWYGEWQEHAIGVLQKVAGGQLTPEAGADQLSKRAKELAAKTR
jgi:ABC-type glycerol-3-phosphate transport system substrate-binding protein